MNLEFFSASLPLQIALGGGYLGYLAGYAGIRDRHQQIDVAFLTISFGLVATLVFSTAQPAVGDTWASAAAVIAAIVTGLIWRKLGRRSVRWFMKSAGISYADDDPSVLTTIFANTDHEVSQVLVRLDDGTDLWCENAGTFADAPIGPFLYAGDGSIALYATHTYRLQPDGTRKVTEQRDVRNRDWGDNLSIVPASRVSQVDIRFKRR